MIEPTSPLGWNVKMTSEQPLPIEIPPSDPTEFWFKSIHVPNYLHEPCYVKSYKGVGDLGPFWITPPKPALKVWYGRLPESNGKSNWSVILHTGDVFEGFTVHRSEYQHRARYDADCLKHMLGEIPDKPCILDYDGDYVSPLFVWKNHENV